MVFLSICVGVLAMMSRLGSERVCMFAGSVDVDCFTIRSFHLTTLVGTIWHHAPQEWSYGKTFPLWTSLGTFHGTNVIGLGSFVAHVDDINDAWLKYCQSRSSSFRLVYKYIQIIYKEIYAALKVL